MKLASYLAKHDMKPKDFAELIGVDRTTVIRYVAGARTPSAKAMAKIAAVTNGKVRPNDWVPAIARAAAP